MSDFRSDSQSDEPSVDDVRRSDDFIDALASSRPVAPQDDNEATLAALLGVWRDDTRWPPATDLLSESQAVSALNAGLGEKRFRRDPTSNSDDWPTVTRGKRSLSVVGAAAAAVLCIGGFGAVVASAGPGDALYGLRTMLFGAKHVREEPVALAARTELNQVQELISQGDWTQAQERLVAVSSQVESIGDVGQKQELIEQFNDLSAKVVGRDPNASAPPGITYTVPPSSTELVPTVAPTSVPSSPSLIDATTSGASAPPEVASPETGSSNDAGVPETSPTAAPAASPVPASAPVSSSGSAQPAPPTTTMAPNSNNVDATTGVPTPAADSPLPTGQESQESAAPSPEPQTLQAPVTTTVVIPGATPGLIPGPIG